MISRAFRFTITTAVAATSLATMAEAFDLQGHRGARGLMPENTLPGFAKALEIGVHTLELDMGVTADGVVVVNHNPHLEPEITRTADGAWLKETGPALKTLSLSELKTYDVGRLKPGTRYARRFSGQTGVDGSRVPTLAEVFELVRKAGNATVRFNIETKIRPSDPDLFPTPAEFARAVLGVVRDHGMLERVTIQSFDWRTLQAVQDQAPGVRTSYLSAQQNWLDSIQAGKPGPSPWTAGLDVDDFNGSLPDMVRAAGGRVWSAYHREVTPENIARAHAIGLQVKVWTVNDKPRMAELIDMGVDGIITDYPDRLRAVMIARGMPVPVPTPVKF